MKLRAVVGDSVRVDVDDSLAVPVDEQPVGVGDLADDGGLHLPPGTDLHEPVDVGRCDDGHHPLLGLAHEDLLGGEVRVTKRDAVQLDVHAAVPGAGELTGGTRDPGGTEVLQGLADPGVEQLQGALDEQLLHEGVADLHAGTFGLPLRGERVGGQDGCATDAVATGRSSEEDDEVARSGRLGELQVLVTQHTDAQGVDEWVAVVGGVEEGLATDGRQTQAVAVVGDAGHHSGQHPRRVGSVQGPEGQGVHDADRAGTHRHDVAHDATHTGGRALVGFDVGGVIV